MLNNQRFLLVAGAIYSRQNLQKTELVNDMQTWDITRTLYKISDFLSWQRSGSLELSPSFQRRPVWSPSAKSYLIDTIARGLPIPIILVREKLDLRTLEPIRQIVDGQQRIRTVLSYIEPQCLKDYKKDRDHFQVKAIHNKELGKLDFSDLSPGLKTRILNYQFNVHVLPSDVDDKQVLQIFARMNATGVKLNGQELRNANYTGLFKQTVYNLSYEQLERWRGWGLFTENEIARMSEVELTSDLVMLMFKGLATKNNAALNKLYESYDDEFLGKTIIESRFQSVMDAIDNALGSSIRDSEFRRKTLFYSLFALYYDLLYSLNSSLRKAAKNKLPNTLKSELLSISDKFTKKRVPEKISVEISRRTSAVESRKVVFNYIRNAISV